MPVSEATVGKMSSVLTGLLYSSPAGRISRRGQTLSYRGK